jgi:hypothetical protein
MAAQTKTTPRPLVHPTLRNCLRDVPAHRRPYVALRWWWTFRRPGSRFKGAETRWLTWSPR